MMLRSKRMKLCLLIAALTLAVTPAWADPVNWGHAFALQTNGGIVNPGVLVGFNPQPDPPGVLAELQGCPSHVAPGSPPDPCLVLHNQHLEAPTLPTFDVFLSMGLPGTNLLFVPDAIPTDNFSTFHIRVDGRPNVVADIGPARKLFDVFLDFASSSGGIVDASSAVSFNPQPDPPGIFSPNDWGMSFAYTGNSDVSVSLRIYDEEGTQLRVSPVPEASSLTLMTVPFAAAGLFMIGRGRRKKILM